MPMRPLRVLVIDDEIVICQACRMILIEEGCLVQEQATGEDGLQALAKGIFDVVLLDLKLPDWGIALLGGSFGILHGLFNGVALSASPARGLNLAGILTTVFVSLLLVCATAVSLRAGWTRVAMRVVGSWVVAVAMLMLGWLYRGMV